MQKNAIHYHDSNGKYIRCYRPATARSIATTMEDKILVTLVDNNGSATFGHIVGVMLEDGSGKNFIVNMFDKITGKNVQKLVNSKNA